MTAGAKAEAEDAETELVGAEGEVVVMAVMMGAAVVRGLADIRCGDMEGATLAAVPDKAVADVDVVDGGNTDDLSCFFNH
jgi:hypothetical protein